MKHARRIVFALSTLLAVFAIATPASASNLFVTTYANCQGYGLIINADVEGDITLWGDANPANTPGAVGHVVPGTGIEFFFRRTAGTYRPGVTIAFANGKIASKGSDADPIVVVVPTCPTPTSTTLAPTTTAVEATTTTSSPTTTGVTVTTTPPPSSEVTVAPTTSTTVCLPLRRPDEPPYFGCEPTYESTTSAAPQVTGRTLPRTGAGSTETLGWYASGLLALGVLLCLAQVFAPRRKPRQ